MCVLILFAKYLFVFFFNSLSTRGRRLNYILSFADFKLVAFLRFADVLYVSCFFISD